jgi:tetratricopeptide (TPR) repeat protein
MVVGRFDEASREVERARAIDPLSSYASAMALWPLYLDRKFPEAMEAATRVAAADPKNASPHFVVGLSLSMTGHPKRGAEEFQRAYDLDPRPNYLAWVGWARARGGDRAGATRVLSDLKGLSKTSYVQPYNFAIMYAALGEPDSCITALKRGLELRSEEMLEIRASVAMDPLRGDPRFQQILRRMNLAS